MLMGCLDPHDDPDDIVKACVPYSADGVTCVHVSILQHCPAVYPIISDDSAAEILCFFPRLFSEKPKKRRVRAALTGAAD